MLHFKKEDLLKIAHFSRICISPEEVETYEGKLFSVVHWFEELEKINVEGVEPLTIPHEDRLRGLEDVPYEDDIEPQTILSNAKNPLDGFFTVPKVIE